MNHYRLSRYSFHLPAEMGLDDGRRHENQQARLTPLIRSTGIYRINASIISKRPAANPRERRCAVRAVLIGESNKGSAAQAGDLARCRHMT